MRRGLASRSQNVPRHSESDLTHPKCAEDLLRVHKMFTAPQRERSRWVKVLATNLHPGALKILTAPYSQSASTHSKCAEGSLRVHQMCTATARAILLGQSDALALKSTPRRTQHTHRTALAALRPTQSAQSVRFAFTKCAPRHSESDLAGSK